MVCLLLWLLASGWAKSVNGPSWSDTWRERHSLELMYLQDASAMFIDQQDLLPAQILEAFTIWNQTFENSLFGFSSFIDHRTSAEESSGAYPYYCYKLRYPLSVLGSTLPKVMGSSLALRNSPDGQAHCQLTALAEATGPLNRWTPATRYADGRKILKVIVVVTASDYDDEKQATKEDYEPLEDLPEQLTVEGLRAIFDRLEDMNSPSINDQLREMVKDFIPVFIVNEQVASRYLQLTRQLRKGYVAVLPSNSDQFKSVLLQSVEHAILMETILDCNASTGDCVDPAEANDVVIALDEVPEHLVYEAPIEYEFEIDDSGRIEPI